MVDLADGEVSLVVRSKEGLFHTAPLEKNLVVGSKRQFLSECADSDISSCGTLIMGFTPKGELSIFKFDGTKILDASFTDLTNCYFSKGNKFVVATHGSGKATKVTIFRISNKEVAARANQSHTIDIGFMKSGKRYVVFLANDTIVGVQIAPHIMQVFDITSNFEPKGKLEIVPSTDLGGLYFGSAPLLYANNPNTTKDNQKGTLFEIYNLQTMTVHHSSFFAGIQQIDIHPSPNANVILIRGHKYVDTSGQSYYGKNTLDLLDVDGHKKKKITTYNGPIYNLAWNPKGDSFAVCGGFLPSHTVIFDLKGEPIMVAAKDHKNSIFWSPNGEFLAICGFGNLNGEIMIWNLAKKSLLGKCQHGDAGDLEWAPDGRHFVTKVEFKFLREGNTYRVNFQFESGLRLSWHPFEQSRVSWQPALLGEMVPNWKALCKTTQPSSSEGYKDDEPQNRRGRLHGRVQRKDFWTFPGQTRRHCQGQCGADS